VGPSSPNSASSTHGGTLVFVKAQIRAFRLEKFDELVVVPEINAIFSAANAMYLPGCIWAIEDCRNATSPVRLAILLLNRINLS
jgi:hypothetical protein